MNGARSFRPRRLLLCCGHTESGRCDEGKTNLEPLGFSYGRRGPEGVVSSFSMRSSRCKISLSPPAISISATAELAAKSATASLSSKVGLERGIVTTWCFALSKYDCALARLTFVTVMGRLPLRERWKGYYTRLRPPASPHCSTGSRATGCGP